MKTTEKRRAQMRAYNQAHRAEDVARQAIAEKTRACIRRGYVSMFPCADCGGESKDLDHRDGEVKLFNPSQPSKRPWALVWAGWAKCTPRCASCHQKRHRAQERDL